MNEFKDAVGQITRDTMRVAYRHALISIADRLNELAGNDKLVSAR